MVIIETKGQWNFRRTLSIQGGGPSLVQYRGPLRGTKEEAAEDEMLIIDEINRLPANTIGWSRDELHNFIRTKINFNQKSNFKPLRIRNPSPRLRAKIAFLTDDLQIVDTEGYPPTDAEVIEAEVEPVEVTMEEEGGGEEEREAFFPLGSPVEYPPGDHSPTGGRSAQDAYRLVTEGREVELTDFELSLAQLQVNRLIIIAEIKRRRVD